MFSIKKLNSKKFSIKEVNFKYQRGTKRSESLKPIENTEVNFLRDFIVKKLEKCLIIDQINTNKPLLKIPEIRKKPCNLPKKNKKIFHNIVEEVDNNKNTKAEERTNPLVPNKKDPIKKRKKKKFISKTKQEIESPKYNSDNQILDISPNSEQELLIPFHFPKLIIKQKGLGD